MSSSHPQKGLSLISLSMSLGAELTKAAAESTQTLLPGERPDWLTIVDKQLEDLSRFKAFAAELAEDGFAHFVLLGAPQIFDTSLSKFHALDSVDPAEIRALRGKIDPARTLFCVAGTSLEAELLLSYFLAESGKGDHFIAITEPGSRVEQLARESEFRQIYHGHSALSDLGLIPYAGLGLDSERLLKRTKLMLNACQNPDNAANPGLSLGRVLAATEQIGRDKITLLCSPTLRHFGEWITHLLANTTNLIPIYQENVLLASANGDRLFVQIQCGDEEVQAQQPSVRVVLKDQYDIGQAMFLWQYATAVAASRMPPPRDYKRSELRPTEKPVLERDGIQLYADALLGSGSTTLGGLLRKHLDRVKEGDYFELRAYLPRFPEIEVALQEIRTKILEAKQVATVLIFGRAYPNAKANGVFLQITADDIDDLGVPGRGDSFGNIKARQARDDFQMLLDAEHRALRIHLGKDVRAGLSRLRDLVCAAVAH